MKLPPIVHLHTHSTASSLTSIDGMIVAEEFVEHAKSTGANAIAITDHGNIFYHPTFYEACQKGGVKSILGNEMYCVPDVTKQKEHGLGRGKSNHITIIAQNKVGWTNLVKLTSLSNSPSHYYHEPRIDLAALDANKEGLIILTGCPKGLINKLWLDGDYNGAEKMASLLVDVFGEQLFFEVQDVGIRREELDQAKLNNYVRSVAKHRGRPTVFTIDAHFAKPTDYTAHQYLLGINMARHIDDIRQGAYGGSENYWLRTSEECLQFDCLPREIEMTQQIAEMIESYSIGFGGRNLPTLDLPDGKTAIQVLREKTWEGWKRYGIGDKANRDEYVARMKHELADIEQAGMAEYFLIIEDIISWAKSSSIMVGYGRGSAGGSLTLYLLGITGRNLDPIKWGLVWERFYNVGRSDSFPDVDLDIEKERREEVIKYVGERYGQDRVSQLITFGRMTARSALKNVMRTHGMLFHEANAITSLVPEKDDDHSANVKIADAIERNERLAEYALKYEDVFNIASRLEGRWVSYGKHAAAVIINSESFDSGNLPLVRDRLGKGQICGWDMDSIDKLGYLKIDLLGLNELDIARRTVELVKERHGVSLNLEDLPLDDKKTFDLFAQGRTEGVFQLGQALGRQWSRRIKPSSIDEISDLIAIIRPACLDIGMTEKYRKIKFGEAEEEYIHIDLEPILGPTKSVFVFQEQMLSILAMIGMNLKEADILRKAVGHKIPELLAQQEEKFIQLARNAGYRQEIADALWGYIKEGAGYNFNRSHSLGYSLLGYTGAYLKANYPSEFYCASLAKCKNLGDKQKAFERIKSFVNDAKLVSIDIVQPSLKHGNVDFEIIGENVIAFGLSHIKGVGSAALKVAKKCATAKHFYEFLQLCFKYKINQTAAKAIMNAGAIDYFGIPRKQMTFEYDVIHGLPDKERGYVMGALDDSGILPLLAEMGQEGTVEERKKASIFVPNVNRRAKLCALYEQMCQESSFRDDLEENLANEAELLGMPLSGTFEDIYMYLPSTRNTCMQTRTMHKSDKIHLCVKLDEVRHHITKETKKEMAFLSVSDKTMAIRDVVVFPKTYGRYGALLEEGALVELWGWYDEGVKVHRVKTIAAVKK